MNSRANNMCGVTLVYHPLPKPLDVIQTVQVEKPYRHPDQRGRPKNFAFQASSSRGDRSGAHELT